MDNQSSPTQQEAKPNGNNVDTTHQQALRPWWLMSSHIGASKEKETAEGDNTGDAASHGRPIGCDKNERHDGSGDVHGRPGKAQRNASDQASPERHISMESDEDGLLWLLLTDADPRYSQPMADSRASSRNEGSGARGTTPCSVIGDEVVASKPSVSASDSDAPCATANVSQKNRSKKTARVHTSPRAGRCLTRAALVPPPSCAVAHSSGGHSAGVTGHGSTGDDSDFFAWIVGRNNTGNHCPAPLPLTTFHRARGGDEHPAGGGR